MSKAFIEEKHGSLYLEIARRQQRQLSFFTKSQVQREFGVEYWKTWAERKYYTDDYFANYIKEILRTENFITVYKHMRYPLPSAKLVNDEISPQLKRVYYADDSYFKYIVKNKRVESPEDLDNETFENELFNATLFNYNDVIIHDLSDVNKPFRHIVSIDKVVSIESVKNKIKRIAYCATIDYVNAMSEVEQKTGYLYIDDKRYSFYDESLNLVQGYDIPHDLGECPACWISNEAFDTKSDIVRKSIFSFVRPEFEEYVFLHAMWRVAETAGAIPITVKLETDDGSKDGESVDSLPNEPNTYDAMSSQQSSMGTPLPNNGDGMVQVGSRVDVPISALRDNDGKLDVSVLEHFFKFFHFPVETLEYMRDRIKDIERSIIANALGDVNQNNDTAKNEKQISRATDNRQDKLRSLSLCLSWCRNQTDKMMLGLRYGIKAVSVSIFYGSDFFLDNENDLYLLLKSCPNQIEKRNLLDRIAKTRYRFNKGRMERELLLYSLMPFIADSDFTTASANFLVDDKTKLLYLRFNYWISQFEAEYGDIVEFFEGAGDSTAKRWVNTNDLLTALIPENTVVKPEEKISK